MVLFTSFIQGTFTWQIFLLVWFVILAYYNEDRCTSACPFFIWYLFFFFLYRKFYIQALGMSKCNSFVCTSDKFNPYLFLVVLTIHSIRWNQRFFHNNTKYIIINTQIIWNFLPKIACKPPFPMQPHWLQIRRIPSIVCLVRHVLKHQFWTHRPLKMNMRFQLLALCISITVTNTSYFPGFISTYIYAFNLWRTIKRVNLFNT